MVEFWLNLDLLTGHMASRTPDYRTCNKNRLKISQRVVCLFSTAMSLVVFHDYVLMTVPFLRLSVFDEKLQFTLCLLNSTVPTSVCLLSARGRNSVHDKLLTFPASVPFFFRLELKMLLDASLCYGMTGS
jgi:hypothetical protein